MNDVDHGIDVDDDEKLYVVKSRTQEASSLEAAAASDERQVAGAKPWLDFA